ncbi:MAG: ABC transporter permease [Bacteroidaceae bacterium]|nr:ABC transporter permease [Bacteroidaceae bacterium]
MNKLTLYFRQALHMMKEERLFSGIYIAGTALAIAFTMVIAVVYYAKVADIEPEVNRSRTVYVDGYRTRKDYGSMSYCIFSRDQMIDWFYHMKSAEVACCVLRAEKYNNFLFHLKTNGGKRMIQVVMRGVDANFFKVYRHHFVYGRPFTMEEGLPTDSTNIENVLIAIISKDISEQVFGKDVDPVGKTIEMNNNEYRIVGVIEPTSSIASQSYGQMFIPASDGADGVTIVMKEGCTLEDVKKELDEKVHRYNMSNEEYTMELQLHPHARAVLSRGPLVSTWKDILLSLLPKVFVLLLVPALNLSGLVAARMKRRMPEMGVRKAFGAKKSELLHQVITENLVLTLCGGLVGLVITWLLLYVFRSWAFFAFGMVPQLTPEPLLQGEMLFSPFIFLIALGVCMVVNLMATFIPAWWSLRNPIVESMNQKK